MDDVAGDVIVSAHQQTAKGHDRCPCFTRRVRLVSLDRIQQSEKVGSAKLYAGYHLVSSAGDAESTERLVRVPHRGLTQISRRMLRAIDSGTVAMKVGIRQGVCNNSPTEARGSENGWRQSLCVQSDLYKSIL